MMSAPTTTEDPFEGLSAAHVHTLVLAIASCRPDDDPNRFRKVTRAELKAFIETVAPEIERRRKRAAA